VRVNYNVCSGRSKGDFFDTRLRYSSLTIKYNIRED
jgi:hypothetical protein